MRHLGDLWSMRLNRKWAIWLAIGIVVWLFLTLGVFYWVQKPLSLTNAAALGRTVLELGVAGLIAVAGLALIALLVAFVPGYIFTVLI